MTGAESECPRFSGRHISFLCGFDFVCIVLIPHRCGPGTAQIAPKGKFSGAGSLQGKARDRKFLVTFGANLRVHEQ